MKNLLKNRSWFLFLIFLLAFILRLPYFSQPPDYDESYMAFSGFYSRGELFYPPLESFPTSGRLPGIFLIYRFLDDLFPKNFAFIRLASTLFTLMAIFGIYRIGKMIKNSKLGLLAALFLAIFTSQISTASPANAEFFMTPLIVMSFYFFLLYRKEEKKLFLLISGVFAGMAILIKQAAIFEIFFLGVWLLFLIIKRLKREFSTNSNQKMTRCFRAVSPIFIFTFSLLIPLVATIIAFSVKGQLQDLWLQGLGVGRSYVISAWKGVEWQPRLMQLYRLFRSKHIFFFLAGLGGAWLIIKKKEAKLRFVFFWFFFALFEAVFTGYFFDHYFVAIIPPLSLLGGFFLFDLLERLKNRYLEIALITLAVILMLRNSFPPFVSYFKWKIGLISQTIHWQNIGQDIGDAGWIPFRDSAEYLKKEMGKEETLFVWSTTPITYYLVGKRPIIDFFQYYGVLGYKFMLPTYQGFKFDFAGNREKLMQELTRAFPTYILFYVTPEQVFDQLFLFKDFSNFLNQNYKFVAKFGNIVIFKVEATAKDLKIDKEEVTIPLDLIKRYGAIKGIEKTEKGSVVFFEPMVYRAGVLQSFRSYYPSAISIDFLPLIPQLLEMGPKDLVGFVSLIPSGSPDFHLKVKGQSKPVSFIRIKVGNFFWNNQSYGVNPIIKVEQAGDIFDLYFEPAAWQGKQKMEIYFIYTDGNLARTEIEIAFK